MGRQHFLRDMIELHVTCPRQGLDLSAARRSAPGFDGPLLDTLFPASLVSFKGRVIQQVGRIIAAAVSGLAQLLLGAPQPGRHRQSHRPGRNGGRSTTRPSITKQVPRPDTPGSGGRAVVLPGRPEEPSYCQAAPETFLPRRLNSVSSTATVNTAPPGRSWRTTRWGRGIPGKSGIQFAREKEGVGAVVGPGAPLDNVVREDHASRGLQPGVPSACPPVFVELSHGPRCTSPLTMAGAAVRPALRHPARRRPR
jgi:hypothetical protein